MGLPGSFLRAQVISHDAENDGFSAMLSSGQMLTSVRRLYPQADGVRVQKKPLPVRGSWVVLGFLGGDLRNPFMMGAYHPNLADSLPDGPDDPFSEYESNFNGSWSYTNGLSGHHARQYSDNSSFVMGSGSMAIPTIHRHTVDEKQARKRVPFNQSDRNPKPQAPFGWAWSQSVSGGMGGLTVTQSPSGDLSVVSTVTGRSLTLTFNGGTINIDASGNCNVTLPAGKTLNIAQGGNASSDFFGLVSKLVTAFNQHTHPGVSTPTSPWNTNTINSTAVHVSN